MKFKLITAAITMIFLSQLVGCGGGGTPAPQVKGFWEDPANTATDARKAIVLANGDAWLLFLESGVSTRFARLKFEAGSGTFTTATGNGNQYLLQSTLTETASASGTFTNKGTIKGTMTAPSGCTCLNLSYNTARSESIASLADAVGTWKGSYNGGSISSSITVAATTGTIAGNSTSGCNYSGTLSPRAADPAFFDLNFTESCPKIGGGTTDLVHSGIAVLNEAKTTISFAMTTTDKTAGALFVGQKQ